MIYIKSILLAVITFIFLFFPTKTMAATPSEIIQRVSADIELGNNLMAESDATSGDDEATVKLFLKESPTVIRQWTSSSAYYQQAYTSETDMEFKNIILNIKNSIDSLTTELIGIQSALNESDLDALDLHLKQYDRQIEILNTHIESLNEYAGVSDYSWLAWPFWLALVISIVLFIISRGSPILPAEQLRNQFEFTLFKSSLWPLVGSAITYVWYLMTPPGGTFTILYGIIAVGYFQFARALYSYVTVARPAINLAKSEEKTKLEALISSNKFQKESIKEEIKDVEKLSVDLKQCIQCAAYNVSHAVFCKSCGNKFI